MELKKKSIFVFQLTDFTTVTLIEKYETVFPLLLNKDYSLSSCRGVFFSSTKELEQHKEAGNNPIVYAFPLVWRGQINIFLLLTRGTSNIPTGEKGVLMDIIRLSIFLLEMVYPENMLL